MSVLYGSVVLGGAGFIGSRVANALFQAGRDVLVIDGLVHGTGGAAEHVAALAPDSVRCERVEAIGDLSALVDGRVVVDAMGWTRHVEAMADPRRDLELNVASHLSLIAALEASRPRAVIYLGSTHEYGDPQSGTIDEETPLMPVDVQGIHKAAADLHLRLAARRYRIPVISLRFGNTFGEGQPWDGMDLGLIGNFVRDLIQRGTTDVFAGERRRNCVYVRDVADVVLRLTSVELEPRYQPLNMSGHDLTVIELVKMLISAIGSGTYVLEPQPTVFQAIDVGAHRLSGARLDRLIGGTPRTELRLALQRTVDHLRSKWALTG